MCGIVGYIGKNNALPILVDGLRRLEYRGYDSSGIAIMTGDDTVFLVKSIGRIQDLENKLGQSSMKRTGNLGIAHTRWATHGQPTEANAHPHTDCKNKIWLAHNGIIENYKELKNRLELSGHNFKSETDTEVIVHLIEDLYQGNLTETLVRVLPMLKGTYGLVLYHVDEPDKLLAAKRGSPLIVGLAENQAIIASDVSAIVSYTRQIIYLDDGEIAEINSNDFRIINLKNQEINKRINNIDWDITECEKKGYPHFMLKEIFEQPETIKDSLRGRTILEDGKVKLGGLETFLNELRKIDRIVVAACGTARNAGLVGEYMFEEYSGLPCEVDYASEFRYRKPVLDNRTVVITISQSGETADTLAAVREAKEKGALTLGIVNVVGSTIARETDAGVYNHIGSEISVASTKAFTSQVVILSLMTVMLGRQRQMSLVTGQRIIKELLEIPEKIKKILKLNDKIKKIAEKYYKVEHFAYLGRKYNQPVAFEGALKLKELSYIHAEGFASGEMKHGTIALIDEKFPSFFIAPVDSVYEKNLSNMQEIKARGGKIIAITTQGNEAIEDLADDVIYIPKTLEMLTPILSVIPLQLFAYHMAVLNGRDVDKPRNLAKSVTVE
ncbi:glutamine--fructose-6-phosphate transaminase (isomerizing) [Patescibacteria group bacterium]|nr:glutamine--fructose-6-phosphate transaminase (isomerizing) [Patescibacteria group bacterium]MBU1663329.1 glutamine--fructose-6-phosphate transaminase (isomerizing) [Patescibacteria group bacterium]MBU1934211.1 glutamine--fructose-6-phosphate transaminase (isomerizing) [Patescibacteria group bacterium]MBU2234006.1 glutamine--fructose-6-phosphate transaminase (isomerizing) [Patescibacteria group bacterium]